MGEWCLRALGPVAVVVGALFFSRARLRPRHPADRHPRTGCRLPQAPAAVVIRFTEPSTPV